MRVSLNLKINVASRVGICNNLPCAFWASTSSHFGTGIVRSLLQHSLELIALAAAVP